MLAFQVIGQVHFGDVNPDMPASIVVKEPSYLALITAEGSVVVLGLGQEAVFPFPMVLRPVPEKVIRLRS